MMVRVSGLLGAVLLGGCIAHSTITAANTVQPILLGPIHALPGDAGPKATSLQPLPEPREFKLTTSAESAGQSGYSSGVAIVDYQVHAHQASPAATFVVESAQCHGWTSAVIFLPVSLASCELQGRIEERATFSQPAAAPAP